MHFVTFHTSQRQIDDSIYEYCWVGTNIDSLKRGHSYFVFTSIKYCPLLYVPHKSDCKQGSHFDTSPSSMKGYNLTSGEHLGPMSPFLAGLICCGMGSQLLWSNPKVRIFYDRKWYRGSILTLIYIFTMMIIKSFYCFKIIFYYWIVLLFLANFAYVVAIKIKSVLRKSASTNSSPTYTVYIISELLNDYQFLVLVLIKLTLVSYISSIKIEC